MAEKESRAKSAMGGEKKSPHKKSDGKKSAHKKVHVMHVKHADNGGWIAQHDMQPPDEPGAAMPPSEDHIVPPGMDNLQAHMAEHMDQTPEPEPAPAGGGGAPGGGAAPMPGM